MVVLMSGAIGIRNLFLGTMAGAVIVLAGAFYALFFALCRMHGSRAFAAASLVSYALLALAVYVLVESLDLDGIWLWVATVILAGYFLAPRAIWRLCVGTHGDVTRSRLTDGASR
jgi:hypothetical protein